MDHERQWWHTTLDAEGAATAGAPDLGSSCRVVARDDAEALAQLMLDAYEGTIDSEGETIVEAREEIDGWFGRDFGDAVCAASSVVVEIDRAVASAVLTSRWDTDEILIGFVITASSQKGRGIARIALLEALDRLRSANVARVRAAITVGNVPSERLFESAGFFRGDAIDAAE